MYLGLFLMKDRSKLFSIFKSSFAKIQNQFGVSIRTFLSDNALEYLSSQFQEFITPNALFTKLLVHTPHNRMV